MLQYHSLPSSGSSSTYTVQYQNIPGGGSGDFIIVILSQNLEQLIKKHRQKSDDHWDSLHTEKTLQRDGNDARAKELNRNKEPL